MEVNGKRQKPGTCDECNKVEQKLMVCSECRQAWYCSPSCQKAAWKQHKADCKRHQQQLVHGQSTDLASAYSNQGKPAANSNTSRAQGAQNGASCSNVRHANRNTSRASQDPNDSSETSIRRVVNAPENFLDSKGERTDGQRSSRQNNGASEEDVLPFKYRTEADPSVEDLGKPLQFKKKELDALAEVYPGLLHDGDSHSINLDRYIMKKVKTWYVQYLYRKQMQPPCGSNEDNIRFFQGLMNGDIKIASTALCKQHGNTPPSFVLDFNEQGVAVAMSLLLDHSKKGIAKHPKGFPKIIIYEPEHYTTEKLI